MAANWQRLGVGDRRRFFFSCYFVALSGSPVLSKVYSLTHGIIASGELVSDSGICQGITGPLRDPTNMTQGRVLGMIQPKLAHPAVIYYNKSI